MIYLGKPKKVKIYINTGYKKMVDIKSETGCDLIFNGGIYNMASFVPYCHLKSDGRIYSQDQYKYWGYGWNGDYPKDLTLSTEINKVQNYIDCICLAKDGKPEHLIYNPDMGGARPRTAWGIKKNSTHIFYASKTPMTPEALQQFMILKGCDSALLLDGGDSTQGIFENEEVYSDRIVHNFICVWLNDGIVETDYDWNGEFEFRSKTEYLVLHHAAASEASIEDVHRWHLSRGWTGIGYHYYVRKDGSVYRGRPENTVGAHEPRANKASVAICFEGNFENETMPDTQLASGSILIKDILSRYPGLKIKGHNYFAATACPGKNFPFQRMTTPTVNDNGITVKLPMLRNGSRDRGVMTVQRLLIILGYNAGTADGIYGPRTEGAVKEFQKRNGLGVDGIVGKNTWDKILK